MVLPIKKRITSNSQTSNHDWDGASGLDILSAVIDSRLVQSHDFSSPSSFDTMTASESTVVSKSPIRTVCMQSEDGLYMGSTIDSTSSLDASVAKVSSQKPDHNIIVTSTLNDSNKRYKRSKIFPEILMGILSNPDYAHIIGWSPSGRSFVILDTHLFSYQILPKYFRRVVFRSFVRKLNRWGFRSMRRSPEEGRIESNYSAPRFEHKHFSRDEPEMCARIFCKSNPLVSKRIPPAKMVDGRGSGDDMSDAGDDGVLGGINDAVVISPSVSVASILSAEPVAAGTTVVTHPPSRQLQTTGGIGHFVPQSALNHQRHNEEFPTFPNECILMALQLRRQQALMNQARMMRMSSEAEILKLVMAEKWQQMMLLNGGPR
jgi:hypothetical protein